MLGCTDEMLDIIGRRIQGSTKVKTPTGSEVTVTLKEPVRAGKTLFTYFGNRKGLTAK